MKQLELTDIDSIDKLLNVEHKGVVQIALQYGVPESTMRYFIQKNNIEYKKKRSVTQRNSAQQLRGVEQYQLPIRGNNGSAVSAFELKPNYVPIPNSNNPEVQAYLLNLKTQEADILARKLHEIEIEHRKLKNDFTDLEIAQKHFDREKQLAIEDAVRNKGGFDLEKGMQKLNENPILSTALAGLINKVMNVPGEGAQLAGVNSNNPLITEFFNELTKKTTDMQNKVATVAFFLMEDSIWLEQALMQVKAKQKMEGV